MADEIEDKIYAAVGVERAPGCPRCRRRSAEGADTLLAIVEAIKGADTVRARWPLRVSLLDSLPVVVELDDDTARFERMARLLWDPILAAAVESPRAGDQP